MPTVVEAMRLGASDYLPKPIEAKDFEAAMARIMADNRIGLQARFSTSEATFQSPTCSLKEMNCNHKRAAQRLNICYKSLLNKLHRWQSEDQLQSAPKELQRPLTFKAGSGS